MDYILKNAMTISKEVALKLSIILYDNECLVIYDSVNNVFLDNVELCNLYNNFQKLTNMLNDVEGIMIAKNRYKFIKYTFKDKFVAISCKYLHIIDRDGKCRYLNAKLFGKEASRLMFYDNYNVFCKSKYNKYIDLPFSEDIDFLPVDKSFVLNNIENFRLPHDIKVEEKLRDDIKYSNFSYNDVLMYNSKVDFILCKWKLMHKLKGYINFNKYSLKELFVFRKLQVRLSDGEFRRFLGWYQNYNVLFRTVGRFDELEIYNLYLADRCDLELDWDLRIIISDIINMSKELKCKIDIKVKSLNGLRDYHYDLVSKVILKSKKVSSKKYTLQEKWVDVDKKLTKYKNIKVLNSDYLLHKESRIMNHCVITYNNKVKRGTSYIFHISYKNQQYTCELKYRGKKVYIAQLLGKYNKRPSDDVIQYVKSLIIDLHHTGLLNMYPQEY